jgi:hypothetical protein
VRMMVTIAKLVPAAVRMVVTIAKSVPAAIKRGVLDQ